MKRYAVEIVESDFIHHRQAVNVALVASLKLRWIRLVRLSGLRLRHA
jgi:hypothetical protein